MSREVNDPGDGCGENPLVVAGAVGIVTGISAGVLYPFEVVFFDKIGASYERDWLFLQTWVVLAMLGMVVVLVDAFHQGTQGE